MDIDGTIKLSKRLSVGLEIFESIKREESVHFNKLVEICKNKGIASRKTVSTSLDSMYDQGILTSKMVESNGRWTKQIYLTNEGTKLFTKIKKKLIESGYKFE